VTAFLATAGFVLWLIAIGWLVVDG